MRYARYALLALTLCLLLDACQATGGGYSRGAPYPDGNYGHNHGGEGGSGR
jgi:hypothetical protein